MSEMSSSDGVYGELADGGDASAIHELVQRAAAQGDYVLARSLLSRLGPRHDPRDLVSVAPDIWAAYAWAQDPPEESSCDSDASFVVVSPDSEGTTAALELAKMQLFCVVADGRVLDRDTIENGWDTETNDWLHSPNCVATELTPAGRRIWADTKSVLPAPMAKTMLRLVTEELTRSAIPAHVIAPPDREPYESRH